jgi:uncharacterized surface protein with fasciclin (FAS1) repeats
MNPMKKYLKINNVIFILFVLAANFSCNTDNGIPVIPLPETNLIEVAAAEPDLSTLVVALERANLTATLEGSARYTVFAPSNSAFTAFLAINGFGSIDDIPLETLTLLMSNHVVSGLIDSANLINLQKNYLATQADGPVAGTNLALYFDASDGVTLNGISKVSEADILASNGAIHMVDTVIDLPTIETFIAADENFKDLDTAFDLISPVSALPESIKDPESGPITLFAPATHAFEVLLDSNNDWEFLSDIDETLLTAILEHHILDGNTSTEELAPESMFTTLEGDEITVNSLNGNIEITDGAGNAGIVVAPGIGGIQSINGIIHPLPEQVMIPDTTN